MENGIKRLQIENYKKVKFVDITPRSDMVIISGKNAVGKSSIIDAIWEVLSGSTLSRSKENKVSEPIREGEAKARISLEFDEYTVTKVFTESGPRLTVTNNKGFKASTPQKLIDNFIGDLSFDLSKFINMGDHDRTKLLLDLVDVSIEINGEQATLEEANDAYQGVFDDRALANKDVLNKKGLLSAYDDVEEVEAIDVKELFEKKEGILSDIKGQKETKETLEYQQKELRSCVDGINQKEKEIEELKDEVKEMEKLHKGFEDAIEENEQKVSELEDLMPSLQKVKEQILEVDKTNKKAAEYEKKQTANVQVSMAQAEADKLTGKLANIKESIAKGLKEAEMPIEGLSLDDKNIVTFNGKPLSQASQAEKLKVAISIVKAQNPDLKVIRVSEASLFDSDSMAYIEAITKDGWQIWAERISDEKGEVGFYIEDGSITAIDGKEIEKQKPEEKTEKKATKKKAKKTKVEEKRMTGVDQSPPKEDNVSNKFGGDGVNED